MLSATPLYKGILNYKDWIKCSTHEVCMPLSVIQLRIRKESDFKEYY